MNLKKHPKIFFSEENCIKFSDPILIENQEGSVVEGLMLDEARRQDNQWTLHGWCVGRSVFRFFENGGAINFSIVHRSRPDVASSLGLIEPLDGFGFVVEVPACSENIQLEWWPKFIDRQIGKSFYTIDLNGLIEGASCIKKHSVLSKIPAKANLESASYIENAGLVVISGWATSEHPSNLFVQTDDDDPVKITGVFCVYRQDVFDTLGKESADCNPLPGFVAYAQISGQPKKVKLLQQTDNGEEPYRILCEQDVKSKNGDPKAIFQALSGLFTPPSELPRRYACIDVPVLDAVIQKDRDSWQYLPVQTQRFGRSVANPQVSMVVPLYGRTDFVEHQLMEFSRDPWLKENAEIIYVLDDPALLDAFLVQSRNLYNLYQLPFTWVWGTVNRGFSGANNLGASIAKGKHLLFLNSDVFPNAPGWLQTLVNTLESSPYYGAVAPKLLHFDGSIQHAGMAFEYRTDLGFYINHHPHMGLAPELDPHTRLAVVPAVTGACMLLRREHFDLVGGWDTGYLIGDFEDSDLCLKLRDAGLQTIYEPRVNLTHLERQSFKLVGGGDFRARVVAYNATRHQMRWHDALQELSAPTDNRH